MVYVKFVLVVFSSDFVDSEAAGAISNYDIGVIIIIVSILSAKYIFLSSFEVILINT